MKNLLFILLSLLFLSSSCDTSTAKIETKLGITDSTAQSLLKIPYSVDFSVLKSHEKEIVKGIEYFKLTNNDFGYALCSRFYGVILNTKGDYIKAQSYYLQAYDVFDKLDKKKEKARVCIDIGWNYSEIGSKNLVHKYYTKALEIGKQLGDSLIQGTVLMNYGIVYRKTNADSALFYYQQALKIMPETSAGNIRAKLKYNIANQYFDKKEFNKSKSVYEDLLNEGLKSKNMEVVSVGYNALAAIYLSERKIDKSLDYYNKAIRIADSIKHVSLLMKYKRELIKEYEFIGDFKNAFIESKKLKIMSDSLLNKEKEVAVLELDIKYQSEKKEVENLQLKKDSNIKLIAIGFLAVVTLILFFLFRSRSILAREKSIAYDVLMAKYKIEKLEKEKQSSIIADLGKMSSSTLSVEKSLMDRLIEYFTIEKPYLNPKLKVEDVAKYLQVNQKELAAAIKQHDNSNFNVFINKLRVEEARRKFEDPAFEMYKMEVISEQSGFGTIQSFYNAFELYTGIKPAYYRMQMKST